MSAIVYDTYVDNNTYKICIKYEVRNKLGGRISREIEELLEDVRKYYETLYDYPNYRLIISPEQQKIRCVYKNVKKYVILWKQLRPKKKRIIRKLKKIVPRSTSIDSIIIGNSLIICDTITTVLPEPEPVLPESEPVLPESEPVLPESEPVLPEPVLPKELIAKRIAKRITKRIIKNSNEPTK